VTPAQTQTIVVSNRGPLSFRFDAEGELQPLTGGGGLVSSLRPLLAAPEPGADAGAKTETMWISMTMGPADEAAVAARRMRDPALALRSVTVDPDTYRMAYDVVANTTLWYTHHHLFDLPHRPRFDRHWHRAWDGYRAYNQAMADVVAAEAALGALVLVQDYHFSLLGRMLAQGRPDLATVHFCHIPFADPNMLGVLPDHAVGELLAGLAGFGACGFHAQRWAEGFRACFADADLAALAGLAPSAGPPSFVSSLTPDQAGLRAEAAGPECARSVEQLRAETGGRRIILRVDRVEPSKNIVRGMLAFEELLETHPEWVGAVVHLALVYPSRQGLADYLALEAEVAHVAERINHTWGTAEWRPIVLHVEDDRARSVAALTISDVLLVNPVRDGLNLVAKEGPLINTAAGVLVLSRQAGVWEELAEPSLDINPFDITGTAEALHAALVMDPAERRRRADELTRLVEARTAADWMQDQRAAAGL
jgi:trehalose 6-phosphate synthase